MKKGPRVIQVIESDVVCDGVPFRQYHSIDGELLAESKLSTRRCGSYFHGRQCFLPEGHDGRHESVQAAWLSADEDAPKDESGPEPTPEQTPEPSKEDLVAEMTAKLEKAR